MKQIILHPKKLSIKIICYYILSICLFISTFSYSQDFEEVYIAVGADIDDDSRFGESVSISGNYALVSDTYESEDATGENTVFSSGAAYVFKRNAEGNWSQVQKLVASDRNINQNFGYTVDISGNHCIIATPYEGRNITGDDYLSYSGAAYIFELDADEVWYEKAKLVASDRAEYDYFGCSSAISGNYAIVGAKWESEDAAGGSPMCGSGSAYIFEKDEYGNWNEVQKIVAPDRDVEDEFGNSVCISGNYAIVGAYGEDDDASGENTLPAAGSAYIYERQPDGNWISVQKIVASDRNELDQFGNSVSISGNYAVVAAGWETEEIAIRHSGAAYIFKRNTSGVWEEIQKIVASDRVAFDLFGSSVDISGDYIIVGADHDDKDSNGTNLLNEAGSAYIFKKESNGLWSEKQKITASTRESENFFGHSVGIDNDYAIVGIDQDDEVHPNKAYILESCSGSSTSDPENIIENGDFGFCILSPWSVLGWPSLGVECDAVIFDGKCKVSVYDPFTQPQYIHAQLYQELSATQLNRINEGASYTLTFDAFADEEKYCLVSFEETEEPWAGPLLSAITISKEPTTFSFDFIASAVFSKMRLSFKVGIDATPVVFDNVRLVKKSTPNLNDPERADFIKVFPNPASEYIEVTIPNPASASLYNSLGLVIRKWYSNSSNNKIPVADLPDGLYFIEIRSGNTTSLQRLIIQH